MHAPFIGLPALAAAALLAVPGSSTVDVPPPEDAAGPAWAFEAGPEDLVLAGGLVWTDGEFVRRDVLVSRDGTIVEAHAADARPRTIDVSGRFLIPGLCEAHTHRYSSSHDAKGAREMFLGRSVFYAANLNSPAASKAETATFRSRTGGVDVLFAAGGLTATDGHPVRLYEGLHERFRQPKETFWVTNVDDEFHIVDDAADLGRVWSEFVEDGDRDVVKVYLLHSERYDELKDDESVYGGKGLDPALVPAIVERAHAGPRPRRVFAHVETRADFRTAVEAGVDVIAHTAGYGIGADEDPERYLLTDEDIEAALDAGTLQITTSCVAFGRDPRAVDIVGWNLRELHAAGVPILFGSDSWMGTDPEFAMLRRMEVFDDDADLLRAWIATGPALFPELGVGALTPGHAADVAVLGSDPSEDITATASPELLVKGAAVVYAPAERREDRAR